MKVTTSLVDLGWCIAKMTKTQSDTLTLTIMHPSDDDGVHTPASSVTIYSREEITKLRDFLTESLGATVKERMP